MSNATLNVVLLVFFSLFSARGMALPKYPQLKEWSGQVWLTNKDGKRELLKKKTPFVEKARIETALGAFVVVQLDETRSFSLLGGSDVYMPAISYEAGEVPLVILKSGSIRWQQSDGKPAYGTALRSDLFELMGPSGDYLFSIDPANAYAEVRVYKGSLEFSALNGEDSAKVVTGQQVGFKGVIEGGEIAYDVLLKGRKIPRGRLTAVTAISEKDMSQLAREEKDRQQKEKAAVAAEARRQADVKKQGRICSSPAARFNECAWVCHGNPKSEKKSCLTQKEGVSCVRSRCNANGAWSDEFVLDAEKGSSLCGAKPVVGPCDY